MRRLTILLTISLLSGLTLVQATELSPRMVFDKYLFAEGVNPEARDLTRLIVKFFDEDEVRLIESELVSQRGADLGITRSFLESHPEVTPRLYMKKTSEAEYRERTARVEAKSGQDLIDLFSFHIFELPEPAVDPRALLAEILLAPEVEIAYYESIPIDLTCTDIDATTPDYEYGQTYHDPAPLGTDLDFAQALFGADVVDGGGTGTWTGIFERGMQITHEDVTLGIVATDGIPSASNDHGTAVMGILGACDDNGVGMLGYLADQQMRLYQRNSTEYASVAEVYDLANSDLISGEVTNSSWGYLADPMPAGQSCPCNPGQNGVVACEYDPGVKAAIQAGVAADIHYFLAAGNGCVDLDDTVFGTYFQWPTETGSVYVGGSESPAVGNGHDPRCYTNFGSRVTSYGWAEGIYSTGYGYLFSGWGDPDEWYDNDFGGTSGASPMVGGCGGVLNNIWRSQYGGNNISPNTLRDMLQINGTPCNDPTIEIGVLPNLFGILAPDLEPLLLSGWDAELVPNNTSGDHTIPANLLPYPASTYFGWVYWNSSHFSTANPAVSRIYRDDVFMAGTSTSFAPRGSGFVNGWETTVRGGNHYWKLLVDPLDDIVEADETDNSFIEMYVWDGIELERDVPQTWTRGPQRDPEGVTWYAKDGFYNGGDLNGWWEAYGVMPETDANYNMFIHSVAPTATSGFTTYEAHSGFTTMVDFVGCNQNQGSVPNPAWVSVLNWDDADDDYTVEGVAAGDDHYFGALPASQMLEITATLGAGEILDIYEMSLVAGTDVWFNLSVTGGNADPVVLIYGPTSTYFARADYDWIFNNGGAGESESGVFTPVDNGFHGVVVCKNMNSEINDYANYNFYWGPPAGDLIHYLRSGWDYEMVARNEGSGSMGVLPAILNEGNSVADNAYMNIGAGVYELGSNSAFYLDGPQTSVSGDFTYGLYPGDEGFLVDKSLNYVKGGRHEVGARIDIYGEVFEELPDGEFNNHYYRQYSWAPYVLTDLTPVLRTPPPNFINTDNPDTYSNPGYNQDGYTFETDFWTAVGFLPANADDFYVLIGYDYHSTGSEDGFLYHVEMGYFGAGYGGFLVMNGNNLTNNQPRDFGLTNNYGYPATPSIGDYVIEGSESIQDCSANQMYGPFTIAASHVIHAFDISLAAGSYPVVLDIQSGADLGIAIFGPGTSYGSVGDALLNLNSGGAGVDESGDLVTADGGWHGIVVYKTSFADLTVDGVYTFQVGGLAPRIPAPVHDLTIIPVELDPSDDLLHFDFDFSDVVEDIYGVPLIVDHYILYWAWEAYDDFPGGWYAGSANTDSEFLNVAAYLEYSTSLYFMVTAVDEDGVMTVIIDDEISVHHVSEQSASAPPGSVPPLQKQVLEVEPLPSER
jgi:serine protease